MGAQAFDVGVLREYIEVSVGVELQNLNRGVDAGLGGCSEASKGRGCDEVTYVVEIRRGDERMTDNTKCINVLAEMGSPRFHRAAGLREQDNVDA